MASLWRPQSSRSNVNDSGCPAHVLGIVRMDLCVLCPPRPWGPRWTCCGWGQAGPLASGKQGVLLTRCGCWTGLATTPTPTRGSTPKMSTKPVTRSHPQSRSRHQFGKEVDAGSCTCPMLLRWPGGSGFPSDWRCQALDNKKRKQMLVVNVRALGAPSTVRAQAGERARVLWPPTAVWTCRRPCRVRPRSPQLHIQLYCAF